MGQTDKEKQVMAVKEWDRKVDEHFQNKEDMSEEEKAVEEEKEATRYHIAFRERGGWLRVSAHDWGFEGDFIKFYCVRGGERVVEAVVSVANFSHLFRMGEDPGQEEEEDGRDPKKEDPRDLSQEETNPGGGEAGEEGEGPLPTGQGSGKGLAGLFWRRKKRTTPLE